jgi:hypothetical protein
MGVYLMCTAKVNSTRGRVCTGTGPGAGFTLCPDCRALPPENGRTTRGIGKIRDPPPGLTHFFRTVPLRGHLGMLHTAPVRGGVGHFFPHRPKLRQQTARIKEVRYPFEARSHARFFPVRQRFCAT